MATKVSPQMRWIADQWENNCGYKSAVLSGIVPDKRHLENGGFHCSIEDLLRFGNGGDYSNVRKNDKGYNPQYGAAIDMSMSPSDMTLCYSRVSRVWKDKTDPRRVYINCINCYDGSGDAARLDFDTGTSSKASADHKWHNHAECHRKFLLNQKAADAIVSVLKGESKAAWLKRYPEDAPATTPTTKNWTEALVDNLPTIKNGSKGDAVKLWQHLLILRGVVGTSQWGAYCDGAFGKNTTADTKELQKKFGLTQTGAVDETLWKVGLTGKKS